MILRTIRKVEGTATAAPRGAAFQSRPASRRGPRIPRQNAAFTVAKDLDKRMARKVLAALKGMKRRVNLGQIASIVGTASPDDVYRAASAGGAEALAVNLQADTLEGIQAAGDAAGRQVRGPNVVIDLGRPAVMQWAADHAAELVTNINTTQREAVKLIIEDGLSRGRHPMRMAKDIRGAVGLNRVQAQALINRRASMEAAGKPAAQIDKALARYEAKMLRRRAITIARTESMKAVNTGRRLLWEQLKEDGALPAVVEQQWLTGEDERVCPYCGPLHLMRQPIGRSWTSGPYTVKSPPLHVNCRCSLALLEPGEEENLS